MTTQMNIPYALETKNSVQADDIEIENQQIENQQIENQRFYENEYPREGDFVIVEISEINDIGAYVSLLEYGEVKGMIPINEMTNRRFKSINKLAKVGRTEVALVLKVDEEKGYIDLSKSRVTKEDTERCEDKWNKAKCIQSIMNRVAVETSKSLKEIHENITWNLYKKYENLYDKFKECVERDNFDDVCDGVRRVRLPARARGKI